MFSDKPILNKSHPKGYFYQVGVRFGVITDIKDIELRRVARVELRRVCEGILMRKTLEEAEGDLVVVRSRLRMLKPDDFEIREVAPL